MTNISVLKVFARLIARQERNDNDNFLSMMLSFKVTDLCVILNINRNRYYYLKRVNKLESTLIEWRNKINESEETL